MDIYEGMVSRCKQESSWGSGHSSTPSLAAWVGNPLILLGAIEIFNFFFLEELGNIKGLEIFGPGFQGP